jgi:hypothetical protein
MKTINAFQMRMTANTFRQFKEDYTRWKSILDGVLSETVSCKQQLAQALHEQPVQDKMLEEAEKCLHFFTQEEIFVTLLRRDLSGWMEKIISEVRHRLVSSSVVFRRNYIIADLEKLQQAHGNHTIRFNQFLQAGR